MTASPISDTIAKIDAADAAVDDVIDMAALAMSAARRIGAPTRDPIAAIYDQRVKRQARRLLLAAAMHLYGLNAVKAYNVRQILGSLSSIDLAGADDFETMAECWQRIEDTAREMARECREYMGDAP